MKKILYLSIFMIALISLGCKKDRNDEKIEITTDNLTTCPKDFNCTYLYNDNADFGDSFFLDLKKGNYRVFKYSALLGNGFYAKYINIRVPINVTQFKLTSAQILEGNLHFANPCPTCNTIGFNVTGGSFKGVKIAGSSPKWLLDGEVYLGATGSVSSVRDTIRIKQYFTPDPVKI